MKGNTMRKATKRCLYVLAVGLACLDASGENSGNEKLVSSFADLISDMAEYRGERGERVRQIDERIDLIGIAANGDTVVLYRNFSLSFLSRDLTENEGYLMMYLNDRLRVRFSIPLENIIHAALPMMPSDVLIEQRASQFCLDVATNDGRDFIPMLQYLKRQKAQGVNPEPALIDYMFQGHPARALSALRSLYGIENERALAIKRMETYLEGNFDFGATSSLRPGAERKSVLAYLGAMAESPEWWVRLCVAETMRKVPEVQVASVVTRLRSDEHALVKASINGLDAWGSPGKHPPQFRSANSDNDPVD